MLLQQHAWKQKKKLNNMLIDGKLLAQQILEDLKKQVAELQEKKHIHPHLGVVVVGDDPATASYVRQKKRMGEQIGGVVSVYHYPLAIKETELEHNIEFLQKNGDLHGLIIQLPLPEQLDTEKLTAMIDKDKDVDGFKEESDFNEPIAEGVIKILEYVFNEEKAKIYNKGVTLNGGPSSSACSEREAVGRGWRAAGPRGIQTMAAITKSCCYRERKNRRQTDYSYYEKIWSRTNYC